MNVLSFDIDGVLNSFQSTILHEQRGTNSPIELCPIAIANFNYVLEQTKDIDLKILCHSNWNKQLKKHVLWWILESAGVKGEFASRFIGYPPMKMSSSRWEEISFFVSDNNPKKFLAIDDRDKPWHWDADNEERPEPETATQKRARKRHRFLAKNYMVIDYRVGLDFKTALKILKHFDVVPDLDSMKMTYGHHQNFDD